MIFLIDTNVIVASLTDSNCKHMLYQVFNNIEMLRIAVDDSAELVDEYYAFLEKYIDTEQEHVAVRLLQKTLLERDDIMLPLPTKLPSLFKDLFAEHEYTTIEEKLVRIVANAKHLGLRLLLAGKGISSSRLRPRKLDDPRVRRALQRQIPWLDIYFASQRKNILELPPIANCNARLFELLTARFLQTHHATLRCVKTPVGVKGEEIDLYGYESDGDTLIVWIGECKQRQEGKEEIRPITIKEVKQLQRKMEAARQYESSRTDLGKKKVQIKGLIITNAVDFFDDYVGQEANRIGAELLSATLSTNWTNNEQWDIHELSKKKVVFGRTEYGEEDA